MLMVNIYQKESENDQEIPQSKTADQPMALQGRDTEHSHSTKYI